MKLLSLSTLATIALTASRANAGCYSGGNSGDRQWINENISKVCQGFGVTFSPLSARSSCWDTGNGIHYNFEIENKYNAPHYMDPAGCVTYMLKESNGCDKGGDSTYNDIGWRFVLDPNNGKC